MAWVLTNRIGIKQHIVIMYAGRYAGTRRISDICYFYRQIGHHNWSCQRMGMCLIYYQHVYNPGAYEKGAFMLVAEIRSKNMIRDCVKKSMIRPTIVTATSPKSCLSVGTCYRNHWTGSAIYQHKLSATMHCGGLINEQLASPDGPCMVCSHPGQQEEKQPRKSV